MALEAQNNPFTSVLMVEAADVEALPDADPSAGSQRLAVGTDHLLYLVNSSGTKTQVGGGGGIANPLATDSLWDAAGDLVQGSGANTAAKLGAGLAGQTLLSAGAAAANAWAYPPGYEFDYVTFTTNVNVTATTEAGATTLITGNAVTYDGSTSIIVTFEAAYVAIGATAAVTVYLFLYDGSTSLGYVHTTVNQVASQHYSVPRFAIRLTPSAAAHTYSVRAMRSNGGVTCGVAGGAGGSGNDRIMYLRQTKV
jgi:hypothetical protein